MFFKYDGHCFDGIRKGFLYSSLLLVLLCCHCWITSSGIFRGEFYKAGEYTLKGKDRALVGHVINTDYVTGAMACLLKCNEHAQCKSVNFEETPSSDDFHRCELNDRKVGEKSSSSGLLVVHLGLSFYELEEDIEDMNYCAASPCLNGGIFVGGCKNKSLFCKCPSGYEGTHCEHFYPKTCKDYQSNDRDRTDAEYLLYLKWPECDRTAKIYCADMNTTSPLEYVTLPAGSNKNFAIHYNKNNGHRKEVTNFEKVQINVPEMKVSREDYRYATSNIVGIFHGFASGSDCFSSSCYGTSRKAEFGVDVTGTDFHLPQSIPYSFKNYPSCTAKIFYPSMSVNRMRWSGKCGGLCGNCFPKEILLEIDGC